MLTFAVLLVLAGFSNARLFNNPVTSRALVYPSPVKYLDTYYIIDEFKIPSNFTFNLLTSKDLQNFQNVTVQIQAQKTDVNVVIEDPEIHVIEDGHFILYFKRSFLGNNVIAAAYSTNILGPYYINEKPVLETRSVSYDFPNLINSFGVLYLIYVQGNSNIYGQRLQPDGLTPADEKPQFLLNATLPWEGSSVNSPFVIIRGDYYYLFYSTYAGCGAGNGIGVARSLFPLGPYEKLGDPIVTNDLKFNLPRYPQLVKDIDDDSDVLVHECLKSTDDCASTATTAYACARSLVWDKNGWPSIEK